MASYPPSMNAYGLVPKILDKIKEAKTPDRFTQDFLGTNLGFSGGSAKSFIPLAKRLGLLSSDGMPTELYHAFRNPNHTKGAMATAMKSGYAQLYDRNEYAHKLDRRGLEGLIVQATGLDQGSDSLRAIASTFEALKKFADFDGPEEKKKEKTPKEDVSREVRPPLPQVDDDLKMNLSYTINLNLPKTDDIAVFNAIFKSIRDNLLGR
jgi:hypothetical protein